MSVEKPEDAVVVVVDSVDGTLSNLDDGGAALVDCSLWNRRMMNEMKRMMGMGSRRMRCCRQSIAGDAVVSIEDDR